MWCGLSDGLFLKNDWMVVGSRQRNQSANSMCTTCFVEPALSLLAVSLFVILRPDFFLSRLDALAYVDSNPQSTTVSFEELDTLVNFYDIPCFFTNLKVRKREIRPKLTCIIHGVDL